MLANICIARIILTFKLNKNKKNKRLTFFFRKNWNIPEYPKISL